MVATLVSVAVIIGLAAVLAVGVRRRFGRVDDTGWPELDASRWWDDGEDDDGRSGPGGVREPRRPLPSGSSTAAVVDPDELAA